MSVDLKEWLERMKKQAAGRVDVDTPSPKSRGSGKGLLETVADRIVDIVDASAREAMKSSERTKQARDDKEVRLSEAHAGSEGHKPKKNVERVQEQTKRKKARKVQEKQKPLRQHQANKISPDRYIKFLQGNSSHLRDAMVLSEILSPPIALRDNGNNR